MSERIAFFLPSLRGGGAERAVLGLARGLARRGLAVDLVLARAEGPHLAKAEQAGRVVDLGAGRVLGALLPLARYLRRERPAALLSTLTHASAVAVLAHRLAGRPGRLVVREGNHVSRAAETSTRLRSRLVPRVARWAYPLADVVVANSAGVAADLVGSLELPVETVRVIPNLVEIEVIREAAAEPLRHPWLGPGAPPLLLAAGRLVPQKGFDTLLRAFALARRERPMRLVVLGEGAERGHLERLAGALGVSAEVRLPGFQANPYPWLARARLFVLSSLWEGSPNVLVEAMALGTPVVATDCPAGPAELLEGGRLGPLVPVGDAGALAAAIRGSLDHPVPAQELRQAAARYGPEVILPQYLDLLLPGGAER